MFPFLESVYAERCLHAGAMGYVNKEAHPGEVIKASREILAGHVYLSPTMTSIILGRSEVRLKQPVNCRR